MWIVNNERIKKELKLLEQIKEAEMSAKMSQKAFDIAQNADRKARVAIEELEKKETEWRLQSEKLVDINEKIAVWNGKKQDFTLLDADACETSELLESVETQRQQAEKVKALSRAAFVCRPSSVAVRDAISNCGLRSCCSFNAFSRFCRFFLES